MCPTGSGSPEHLGHAGSCALPVLEDSTEQLKTAGAPLALSFGCDNSLLVQALSTHFAEVETGVWGGCPRQRVQEHLMV